MLHSALLRQTKKAKSASPAVMLEGPHGLSISRFLYSVIISNTRIVKIFHICSRCIMNYDFGLSVLCFFTSKPLSLNSIVHPINFLKKILFRVWANIGLRQKYAYVALDVSLKHKYYHRFIIKVFNGDCWISKFV